MWKFESDQKMFNIGGCKIGGLPGKDPTVLIGSVFYKKHNVFTDESKGDFDKRRVEEIINIQEEFSDKTGNPCMLDIVGASVDALIKGLDFVSGVSSSPLLMDGVTSKIRMSVLKHVEETGLLDRIVYNSVTPESKDEELEAIKESGLKNVLALLYYTEDFTSKGRVKSFRDLLPRLLEAGVENIIVDTCTLDIPSLGSACKAIYDIKNEFGYPAGCGAHNAIAMWRGLKSKMGKQARNPSMAAADVLPVAVGADMVLYGPVEEANYIFPSVSLIDAAYAQLSIEEGNMPSKNHPIFKIP